MSNYETKIQYYDDFHCIGGACSFTCCKEWKISVDSKTKKHWKQLTIPDGTPREVLPKHTSTGKPLHTLLTRMDGQEIIGLTDTMRCPMLDQHQLCRVVSSYGEEALSETCHIFPREIHSFNDCTEYALVSCCPAVIDYWKTIPELHFRSNLPENIAPSSEHFLRSVRDLCLDLFSSRESSNVIHLQSAFYILHDLYDQNETSHVQDITRYQETLFRKELQETLQNLPTEEADSLIERNELFLDITENYRAEHRYRQYLDPLCTEAERISKEASEMEEYRNFQRVLSPYTGLFRNYLVSEGFTTLYIPDSEFTDVCMMLQWMLIEYAMMQHAVYLFWRIAGRPDVIRYEDLRDHMVLMSRITGYDQEDIEDYLRECFEELIWDFGYVQLLTGGLL